MWHSTGNSEKNPELPGIIMEINDLRGFDPPIGRKLRHSGGPTRKAGRSCVIVCPLPLSSGQSGRRLASSFTFHGRIEASPAVAFAGRTTGL